MESKDQFDEASLPKISKSLIPLPQEQIDGILKCVDAVEKVKGKPGNALDMVVFAEANNIKLGDVYMVCAILFSLMREELLYSDSVMENWTTKPQEGYHRYSYYFQKHYGDKYCLDEFQRATPKTAKSVNFESLYSLLKSKDMDKYKEESWMFDGEFRFLDSQQPLDGNKVSFNSFPRSGNSFLRRFLEQITGITTGANISLHTSTSLQIMGLMGENITDDRTWIIKAHHPFLIPQSIDYVANKVIVCVRNPLDVLPSWASLTNTLNHSVKPEYKYDKDFPEWWNAWIDHQSKGINQWFDFQINDARENRVPIHIVRYEDLVKAPRDELLNMMKFLLNLEDILGTVAEKRVDEVLAKGASATQTYKLKATTGVANANASMYTDEQIKVIRDNMAEWLYFFGYAKHPDQENPTGFFEFEEHKPELLEKFNGFRQLNEEGIKAVNSGEVKQYQINNKERTFNLFEGFLNNLQEPAFTWSKKQLNLS